LALQAGSSAISSSTTAIVQASSPNASDFFNSLLDLKEAVNANPTMKGSVGQVVEKEFLKGLLHDEEKKALFENIIFYDNDTRVIGVEDTKYLFYLKNIVWRGFTRQCGFSGDYFKGRYDFALSFAGANRPLAEAIASRLGEREVGVFYDFNEQHRILGVNVEEYLAPIYRSETIYVVPLLSSEYPTRIWTKFESDHFKDRFGDGAVIPIRFNDVQGGLFSNDASYGGLTFDASAPIEPQAENIVRILCERLAEDRMNSERVFTDGDSPSSAEAQNTEVYAGHANSSDVA
jgi:hypothetical protein